MWSFHFYIFDGEKKNRENVVVLHILLFDNFNFPRKIGVISVNAQTIQIPYLLELYPGV